MGVDLTDVVKATRHVLAAHRGFDDTAGWLNPATWERAAGRPGVAAAEILAAVADVAGWHAGAGLDMADARDQKTVLLIAADLKAAAASLEATVAENELQEEVE